MKILPITCFVLSIILSICSCKKSSDAPSKDYAAAIKDKAWWGTLAYTGKAPEYYSVAFKADNSLTWSQQSGDTPGLWSLDGSTITINLAGSTVQLKATISNDNTFTSFQDNTSALEITSGQQISNASVYLDNTNWKGTIPSSSQSLQLAFAVSSKLTIGADNGTPFGPYTYNRVAAASAIRFSSAAFSGTVFGVITSATTMKGTMGAANTQWNAILQ